VDDDEISAAPGQHAADRSGEPAALSGGVEFRHRRALRRQSRSRKDLLVPAAGDNVPAIAREFVGEVLRIGDAGSAPKARARGTRLETRPREAATSDGAAAG